jgi:hypothetical protein
MGPHEHKPLPFNRSDGQPRAIPPRREILQQDRLEDAGVLHKERRISLLAWIVLLPILLAIFWFLLSILIAAAAFIEAATAGR